MIARDDGVCVRSVKPKKKKKTQTKKKKTETYEFIQQYNQRQEVFIIKSLRKLFFPNQNKVFSFSNKKCQ